jgi:AraC-like DNA-binding protein
LTADGHCGDPVLHAATASIEPLFAGSCLTIARFRCPPGDERWFHENWIGDRPHVVFPHVPVAIQQRGRRAVIADPTQVVVYRAGEFYGREPISPEGDRSTFLTIGAGLSVPPARAFPSGNATVDAEDVLRMRLLVSLCRAADVDPLVIEEESVRLVDRVLSRVRDDTVRPQAGRSTTRRAHSQAVVDAQRYLAATATRQRSLAEIGAAVGVSPFHLARIFRAQTGLSLHGYRDQLRLRTALDRLADEGSDLATLAIELGFASHSHFDGRFKQAFRQPPSTIRALLRRGSTQTRTMMEALRGASA